MTNLAGGSQLPRLGRERIERIIAGALKSTIAAHGPVTTAWVGSAAKRASHQLLATLREEIDKRRRDDPEA